MPPRQSGLALDSDDDEDIPTSAQKSRPLHGRRLDSDKENQQSDSSDGEGLAGSITKHNRPMATPTSRRPKAGLPAVSQVLHQRVIAQEGDKQFYDPDQRPEERRAVRKQLRDLGRELNDHKQEYLQSQSNGLMKTITNANDIFKQVKQTSDATLDSRILVSAADLAVSRARKLAFGSGSAGGIDVDEFVGKIISYMRNSPDAGNSRRQNPGEDSEVEDDGDALDWAYLGRTAALKASKRPPTSDFLLGPLAVQKRARLASQHTGRLARRPATQADRPQELKRDQIKAQENTTTKLVMAISEVLRVYLEDNDLTEEDQGVNLYRFVINPESFSQSIENMFYVSFLVKEGRAAVWEGEDGLPLLSLAEAAEPEQARKDGIKKRQVIATLDMWSWRELCEILDITEPIIPTRKKETGIVEAGGWYG